MRKKQRNGNRLSYTTNEKFEQNYVVGSFVQKEFVHKKEVGYIWLWLESFVLLGGGEEATT